MLGRRSRPPEPRARFLEPSPGRFFGRSFDATGPATRPLRLRALGFRGAGAAPRRAHFARDDVARRRPGGAAPRAAFLAVCGPRFPRRPHPGPRARYRSGNRRVSPAGRSARPVAECAGRRLCPRAADGTEPALPKGALCLRARPGNVTGAFPRDGIFGSRESNAKPKAGVGPGTGPAPAFLRARRTLAGAPAGRPTPQRRRRDPGSSARGGEGRSPPPREDAPAAGRWRVPAPAAATLPRESRSRRRSDAPGIPAG